MDEYKTMKPKLVIHWIDPFPMSGACLAGALVFSSQTSWPRLFAVCNLLDFHMYVEIHRCLNSGQSRRHHKVFTKPPLSLYIYYLKIGGGPHWGLLILSQKFWTWTSVEEAVRNQPNSQVHQEEATPSVKPSPHRERRAINRVRPNSSSHLALRSSPLFFPILLCPKEFLNDLQHFHLVFGWHSRNLLPDFWLGIMVS